MEELHRTILELEDANRKLADAEAAQQVLIEEARHRRRNDLQRLASTFRLQAMAASDPSIRTVLTDGIARIQAVARIDERFERRRSGYTTVEVHDLLQGLVGDLQEAAGAAAQGVACTVDAERHELSGDQAVAVGLIVTELVANALKYAFPIGQRGTVAVAFARAEDRFILSVSDDGVGFDAAQPPKGTGLGRRLVDALARQLAGSAEIRREDDQTVWRIGFPAAGPPTMDTASLRRTAPERTSPPPLARAADPHP